MPTTVYFKICQKGEAFHRFERLKPYLQDKEYLALKLIKKKLSLLKIYLKEGIFLLKQFMILKLFKYLK